MGLAGEIPVFSSPAQKHRKLVEQVLKKMGIQYLAKRGYAKISGGERQLALIARALVQDAKLLIMDEPISNLDFGNQIRVMNMIKELSNEGYSILVSTHNPQMTFWYADKVLVLHDQKVLTYGPTKEKLNEDVLEKIYQVGLKLFEIENNSNKYQVAIPEQEESHE